MNPKMSELGIKLSEFLNEYEDSGYRTIFVDRRTGKVKIIMTAFEEGEGYHDEIQSGVRI